MYFSQTERESWSPNFLLHHLGRPRIHFLQTRGASWTEKEEDDDPTISSRPGKEKEKKMQGLNDKRQATATIGLSANADLLPAQLIVAGEPHCIGALPVLDGVRYLPATGGKVVPSTGKCDGDTGAIPTAIRARAVPLPLPAQWIGHAVQTLDHWSNIPTTYAILEHIIVPWLSKMKARMGLPQTQTCILVVDMWYGWCKQDKNKKYTKFQDYVYKHYPWLKLVYVPGACTDLVQPVDRGMVAYMKAKMRQHYTNKISADVVRELRAGRAPTDFKLDLGAPAMKKLLAESLAHAHALLAARAATREDAQILEAA